MIYYIKCAFRQFLSSSFWYQIPFDTIGLFQLLHHSSWEIITLASSACFSCHRRWNILFFSLKTVPPFFLFPLIWFNLFLKKLCSHSYWDLVTYNILFYDFMFVPQGTYLTRSRVQPTHLVSALDWLFARLAAAILWPIHMLAKKLVYSKVQSAIGIWKVVFVLFSIKSLITCIHGIVAWFFTCVAGGEEIGTHFSSLMTFFVTTYGGSKHNI